MKKLYKGSCHCGKVRFEADIDLEAGTGRCNCSICAKRRFWGARVAPADFRLLADETDIGDYQFNTMSTHNRFCKTCGVAPYGHGYIEQAGGAFVSISLACLDDVSPEELASLPVQYMDGRHNNWWNAPAVVSYL